MPKPILETLARLQGGTLLEDAADKLAEAVLAVDRTGKSARVTITIDIRKATSAAQAVTGECTVKLPKEQKVETLLFPTPEGNLLAEDPRQQKLELREVQSNPAQIREIAAN